MKKEIASQYWQLFEDQPDKRVLFLLEGGTVDTKPYTHTPEYTQHHEPPPIITPLRHSRIPKHLIKRGYDKDCFCVQMQMKDSQLIGDKDIESMALTIQSSHQKKVAMSCGTSDMARIARSLSGKLQELGVTDKTVIIFGAMEPLKHGAASDGPGNIEFAMEALLHTRELKPGVYVGMRDFKNQNKIFAVDKDLVKKEDARVDGSHHRYFLGNIVHVHVPLPRFSPRR